MHTQNKISVVIITGNEENNIKDCLKSVKWADEIIVVDSESNDSTLQIAKEFTDRVIVHKWEGYASQKAFAVSLSKNEWVLSLDADERITGSLAKEILETDLSPELNAALMQQMDGLSVGLNFDMGNSAYWGVDPDFELAHIGPWVQNVHVKDCKPDVYTVPLGEGDVDFRRVIRQLKAHDYSGWFILQAAPAPLGEEIQVCSEYYQFTRAQLQEYYYGS